MNARLHKQSGYTLMTVLILLVVLTLLSMTTSNNTILENRMAVNVHQHQVALECAEAARLATADLLDIYVYKRGWHENQNGELTTNTFGLDTLPLIKVNETDVSKIENWGQYFTNTGDDNQIHSQSVLTSDLEFFDSSDASTQTKLAEVSLYRSTEGLNPGFGAAQNAGYGASGFAAARHGANIIFDIRSHSTSGCAHQAVASSNSDFRYIVR